MRELPTTKGWTIAKTANEFSKRMIAGGLALVSIVAFDVPATAQERIGEIRVHGNHTTPDAEILRLSGLVTGGSPDAVRTLALPGIALSAAGIAFGIGGAVAAARLVRHFVWGLSATDPLTFAAVGALFLAIASIASILPALRILRLDPAVTLRQE